MTTEAADWTTILLDKTKQRRRCFVSLRPQFVASARRVRDSLVHARRDSLWISYDGDLTDALLRSISSLAAPPRYRALLLHGIERETIPALAGCFKRFAFGGDGAFLPPAELAEVLCSENKSDLIVGGAVDPRSKTVTLWKGDLTSLTMPLAAFPRSGDGIIPDFAAFTVKDYGQTVCFGPYEAATDAILYESDPGYRRRVSKERLASEKSLGASIRRLRKQRGLKREDFSPLSPKTIARIEQGSVKRVHGKTLSTIAQRLAVEPREIESF